MTDSGTTERPSLSKDVRLRLALLTDLNALVYIDRKCFPEHYRWQSIYPIGKKWWKVVIESKASQTLVLEDSSGIFAHSVLVFDSGLWNTESKRRNGSVIVRVLSALFCTNPAVWRRLLKVALVRLTYRRPVMNSVVERRSGRIAWAETSAVLPRMARKGYGSFLIQAREQRALEAGATFIDTHVDSENVSSRRMNEKAGYVLISENKHGCLYKKCLADTGRGVE